MSESEFICYDTEDTSAELMAAGLSGFDKEVTQIAAIAENGERFYSPGKVQPFLRWLKQREERFVYAHNAQYDLGNLFSTKLDALDSVLVGTRLIRSVWGKKVFADSFNLWPMSIKKLAPAFGLEKLQIGSMATDEEYVWRDCEVIHAAMSFVWEMTRSLGLPVCPATLGGLCVKIWREWGGENNNEAYPDLREALYGGRVELFKVLSSSAWVCYTDINSLYPWAMMEEYPGPLEERTKRIDCKFGIAEVTVKQPERDICVLPMRDDEGRILFPWGKFRGLWTLPELNAFEERGGKILEIHKFFGTNESTRPYALFTERLYKMRLESGSPAEHLFFKLLMNNLYGRLGATGKIARTLWKSERTKDKGICFGEKVLVNYHMPLSQEVNWTHAAYVTAYGRLALLSYLEKVGARRLIYCDTDSVIFDCHSVMSYGQSPASASPFAFGPFPNATCIPFPTGADLGVMKVETWDEGAGTYAPKMYHIGRKYKAKGVPVRLAREFIETGKAQYEAPFKMREAIGFFDRNNARQLSVWRKVEKHVVSNYDKKVRSGNRYFPPHIRKITD